jgi:tryptophan 7-halogenase
MQASKISRIVIVGGGTAGWMTAAAMSKLMKGGGYSIAVVESEEIGTVGVGEATIPPIMDFNRTMGIDEAEFMRATQASFKMGIEFIDWTRLGDSYIHPFGPYGVQMHGIFFHHFWERHRARGGKLQPEQFNIAAMAAKAGRYSPPLPPERTPLPPHAYAYHFDAGLYAGFLRKMAEASGVVRHEGRIAQVNQNGESGFIESVQLTDGRVVAGDFFVDCSGFRGLLIEQTLHSGYDDWTQWLPCDRAMAVPCDRIATTTPYTRSTAREAGWQWRIPLQHRTGNGYVYCSQFISDDEAATKLLSRLDGTARATPKPLRFVTGKRKQPWKKNCVSLGLASGFMEPLESTSIHLVQSALARLMFLFPGNGIDQDTVDKYNDMARVEWEEIRDFLVLHYTAIERDDTPFWRHCRAIQIPESLRAKREMYEANGNIVAVPGDLFREQSWFAVYAGQHVHPRSWHPFADIPDDAELERRLQIISGDVAKVVQNFPMHDDFLRQHRAAPPLPAKAM